jgi:Poly(R)-hydroxyalkanoic acid synthase subunit (PHA_synth_III_E)
MSTSNVPFWGSDWEKWWFKSPWFAPQTTEATAQDPAAVFASLVSMWFGSHPAITMPAASISLLMKDAAFAWADLMSQVASHQMTLLTGWQAAFAAFAKDVNVWVPAASDARQADSSIESLDELLARWTAIAEPVLQQHAQSEAFITSQSGLMRAAVKWQKARAAVTEAFCKQIGIPTRSEVDEAFRMIHELRRANRRDQYADRKNGAPLSLARKRSGSTDAS